MAANGEQDSSYSSSNLNVFLSFRGDDSGKNFIDQLHTALLQAGIPTMRDDEHFGRRSEDVNPEMLKAIGESRVSIVVFSRNYASSRRCLDGLVKMMGCKRKMGLTVLPVFYDVDPCDVRRQSGVLAEAFSRHEECFKEERGRVDNWRRALTEVGNLSGWHLQNIGNRHELKFIQAIVDEVLTKVNRAHVNVAKYLVGIDSRLKEMKYLLRDGSDVRIVGVYGMGGIGKTTIAKAIYNYISYKFDGSCFLANVGEVSKQHNGLIHLQEQLLFDITRKKNLSISNIDRGMIMIKQRLRSKRVLIVLDDVDQSNQVYALAGKHDWFGLGSRIIVTTRDEHLLNRPEVNLKYEIKELNFVESLELFSWHAFGQDHPMEDYVELSKSIIGHVGGLPLALEVIGSLLFDKGSIPEWESALKKLREIPDYQIQEKLKISYEALDDMQKDIFLDISCFFIGKDKDYVSRILDACDFFTAIDISILIQRSLVTIENHKLRMHDLLRDMGREIIREESPENPGERSRLWFHEDICDVLTEHTGTDAVKGLVLNSPILKGLHFSIEAFTNMHELRLLQVDYICLTEDYRHLLQNVFSLLGEEEEGLFEMLRWLCWHGFPLKYIPTKFHLRKLVILDMQHSNIKQVWKGTKLLTNLEVLNLSHCCFLTSTPDFRGLPKLKRLVLEGCINLVEVHQSIGHLDKIVFLNLKDCKNLWNLPSSISKLKSLENFIISGCSKIEKLPDALGNMDCLKELHADGTAIKQLPSSIRFLKNLRTLSLCGYKGSPSKSWISFFWFLGSLRKSPDSITQLVASFSGLCSLKRLLLKDCSLSEGALPNDIGTLCSLEELDLSHNYFSSLPSSISSLSGLQTFTLSNCTNLQSLPKLPETVKRLYADRCTSIETLPNLECASSLEVLDLGHNNFSSLPTNLRCFSQLESLVLSDCTGLQSLSELPSNIKALEADGCTSMERLANIANCKYLQSVILNNCEKLVEIGGLEDLESIPTIHLEKCNNLANAFKNNLFQGKAEATERGMFDTLVPGSEIPEWFHYQSSGRSISFEVPPHGISKIRGLIVCAVYAASKESKGQMTGPTATVSNKTKGLEWRYEPKSTTISLTRQDHMWISNIPHIVFGNQLESRDQVDILIGVEKPVQVNKCGIHLVYGSVEQAAMSNSQATFWNRGRLQHSDGSFHLTQPRSSFA